MSFGSTLFTIGCSGVALAFAMLIPLFMAAAGGDTELANSFFITILLTAFVTVSFIILGGRNRKEQARDHDLVFSGFLIWIFIPVIGALPLIDALQIGSVPKALFESMSAFTTTGASSIVYPELEAPAIILWRQILSWLGGLWTLVFVVTIIAPMGIGGLSISANVLLQHSDNESVTDRYLWPLLNILPIYSALTIVFCLLLILSGVEPFDALTLAMSSISTSGISSLSGNLSSQIPLLAQLFVSLACLIGAIALPLWLIGLRRPWLILKDIEFRVFVAIILGMSAMSYLALGNGGLTNLMQMISLATTTGFAFMERGELSNWPVIWLLLPSLLGGMALSTSGGTKIWRVIALFKLLRQELSVMSHPSSVQFSKIGDRRIDSDARRAIGSFFIMLLFLIPLGLAIFSLNAESFDTSWQLTIGLLSNSGAALSLTQAYSSVANLTNVELFFGAVFMIVGRFELLLFVVLISPIFWRFAR
jgi:trk system potassium uptake protein TrkH